MMMGGNEECGTDEVQQRRMLVNKPGWDVINPLLIRIGLLIKPYSSIKFIT